MQKHALLFIALLCCGLFGFSQSTGDVWRAVKEDRIPPSGTRYIVPTEYATFRLDRTALQSLLGTAPMEFTQAGQNSNVILNLPLPDGTEVPFKITESPIFEPGFGTTFPNIKTYNGVAVNDPGKYVRFDMTPKGFHGMIMIAGESTVFIDPYSFGGSDIDNYIVYSRDDFRSSVNKVFSCAVTGNSIGNNNGSANANRTLGSCDLRTYRLALAGTGEYTTFHGGTVAGAAAAMVTTMNRVNGMYEIDMAIRMNLVANNNNLIYTNAGSDPYSNGNAGAMINENVTNCNNVIGSGNYDIGHVFGTNSGGLAGLGVVCSGSKARGVTGSGAPVGDPFDIDYVAHEIGHQFDCNHTQNNNCNRNGGTAWEPGSGSTIMGYAGICAPNVQNNSDDHFHGGSLGEMGAFILGSGGNCANTTTLANNAPTITAAPTGLTIPANTPFELTCTASDPDGNTLTYCWEQMDNQTATQPPAANSTNGPAFRSNSPTTNPTRYFPNLTDLLAGNTPTWEVLSNVTRNYSFRCFVRDNAAGGGCNDHIDVAIGVDGNSGPFVVTYPSATGITWTGNTNETVTWNVAGSNNAPVNCANVDILLSTDGGVTFPTTLVANTPNDGSQSILVPNTATTTARVKIVASNNIFFDVSDNDFVITAAAVDYILTVNNPTVDICAPTNGVFNIDIGATGGYNDPVTLSVTGVPTNGTSTFGTNPVTPVGSTTLTIGNTAAIAVGSYPMTLTANSTSGMKTTTITLNVTSAASPVTLSSPLNGATGVAIPTNFTWTSGGAGATYDIDIATDASFNTIVDNATGVATNAYSSTILSASTMYFWRVRATNACGTTAFSTTSAFTTNNCSVIMSTNIPVTISASGTPTITSTLTVPLTGSITDLNVVSLTGTHSWINDLEVTLDGPTGASAVLWSRICNSENNFDVNFDDAAAPGALPCPPTGGGTYQPDQPLSVFNNTNPNGTWTLTIQDFANQDGGALATWGLQVCAVTDYSMTIPIPLDSICASNDATYSIDIGSVGTYTDPVTLSTTGLPAGATASFSSNPVIPVGTTTLTVSNTGSLAAGTYTFSVDATSTSGPKTETVTLVVNDPVPAAVTLMTPANAATSVAFPTNFTWSTASGSGVTYDIDIATDAAFASIVDNATGLGTAAYTSNALVGGTIYFWRVRANNNCGNGSFSPSFSFTTENCGTYASTNVPVTISASGTPTITSTINVPVGGTITDLNVLNLTGTHSWINDLIVTLTGPTGASAILWTRICNNENNFDVNFDDGATPGALPCPPTGGGTYQPNQALSVFNGTNPSGVWTLTIEDVANQDGGALNTWELEICATPACTEPTVPTISATNSGICNGESTTLSVATGTLNDATDWTWYSTSCGGTALGTGTSITVSPTATTDYFVRGEGGCATAGTCGSTTITVNPLYNQSETVGVCSGDSYTFPDGSTQNNITAPTTYTSNLISSANCDSVIVTSVTINQDYNMSETVTVCQGNSYTFPDGFVQANITAPLTYTSNLVASTTCDSVIVTSVNVNPVYNFADTVTVCSGSGYTFPDGFVRNNITNTVTHTSLLTAATSCDSVIFTTVNVTPSYNLNETVQVCNGDSYTFPDGFVRNNITSTVVHTSNLTAANLCDSIIVTTVQAAPNFNLTETVAVCSGASYTFPDGFTQNNITSTFVHSSSLISSANCDSVIVTTVNVTTSYNLNETVAVCSGDSYTFPDGSTQNNITATTTYTSNLVSANLCDSIIVTTVNVNPLYNNTETVTVCSGDSYTFPDGSTQNNITSTVTYTSNLQSVNTCDSVIVTTVNVNPVFSNTETVTVCSGDSYTFPDGSTQTNITATVTYTSQLQAATTCDSLIITTVNVNPVYNNTETAAVCSGDSYTFPDGSTQNNITSTVVYTSNLQTASSCDSIIVTTVNVNQVYNNTETVAICSGASYTFPDGSTQNNITSTVVYTSNLQSATACDSIIVTTVNVNQVFNNTETAAVCSGDSYTFPDGSTQNNITATVTYTSNLTAATGCDSIIVTTVNVNQAYNNTETVAVCSGDSYTFPDGSTQNNLTTTVTYTSNLTTSAGCDSIIATTVNVNPLPTVNLGADTTIALSASLTLDAGAGFSSYLWSSGDVTQTYVFDGTTNGVGVFTVTVEVTDANGCVGTDVIIVTVEDINSVGSFQELGDIELYPNPAEDYIMVNLENVQARLEGIVLYNTLGQEIMRPEWDRNAGRKIRLDLSGVARGTYYLRLKTDRGDWSERVILQ